MTSIDGIQHLQDQGVSRNPEQGQMREHVTPHEFAAALENALKGVRSRIDSFTSAPLSILHSIHGALFLTVADESGFSTMALPMPGGGIDSAREYLSWHGVALAEAPNLEAEYRTDSGRCLSLDIAPFMLLAAKANRFRGLLEVYFEEGGVLELCDLSAVHGENGTARIGEEKLHGWLCRVFSDPSKPHLLALSGRVQADWANAARDFKAAA